MIGSTSPEMSKTYYCDWCHIYQQKMEGKCWTNWQRWKSSLPMRNGCNPFCYPPARNNASLWRNNDVGRKLLTRQRNGKETFTNIIPHCRLLNALISYHDLKFTLKTWQELVRLCRIKQRISPSCHPQNYCASKVVLSRVIFVCISNLSQETGRAASRSGVCTQCSQIPDV